MTIQGAALGAAVAALGLSNKAVYAEDMRENNGGVSSGMEGGTYTDGPDLAPNAMPAAVAGQSVNPFRMGMPNHEGWLCSCMSLFPGLRKTLAVSVHLD